MLQAGHRLRRRVSVCPHERERVGQWSSYIFVINSAGSALQGRSVYLWPANVNYRNNCPEWKSSPFNGWTSCGFLNALWCSAARKEYELMWKRMEELSFFIRPSTKYSKRGFFIFSLCLDPITLVINFFSYSYYSFIWKVGQKLRKRLHLFYYYYYYYYPIIIYLIILIYNYFSFFVNKKEKNRLRF